MKKKMVPWFLILLLLAACAGQQKPMDPLAEMQKVALGFMEVLISQEKDTAAMSQMPNLSEAQKQVVREKKAILVKVWPKATTFLDLVNAGTMPSEDMKTEIKNLIRQLEAVGGG